MNAIAAQPIHWPTLEDIWRDFLSFLTGWTRRYRVETQKFAVLNTGTAVTSMFAGLDTNASVNDDMGNVVAGTTEPTSSNGYARNAVTWATPAAGALDAAVNALNSIALTWTSSGGAFSTGGTTLKVLTLWNTSTLATTTEAAGCGRATITTPQAVNASGITLTIAISGLSMGCISS
jgi:hypothetical protein